MDFNEHKATAVAAFFLKAAGGEMEDLKLMKLMYLAEREAIRVRNVGITGDRFVSMQNGPVLSNTLDCMTPREQIESSIWKEWIHTPRQWTLQLKQDFPTEQVLSRREIAILQEVWQEYGHEDKWKLVELTHSFREWRNPGKSSLNIAFQDILAGLGLTEDERKSRMEEHRAMSSRGRD